jgi:hypothetical protein
VRFFSCVANARKKIAHVSCLAQQHNCNLLPLANYCQKLKDLTAMIAEKIKLQLISQPANENRFT